MPSITVNSSTGTTKFKYTISTPAKTSAKSIDKNLPTVLFIPAVYLQRDIFHLQFGDPKLRRFNLVTFDLRAHGETTGTKMPEGYGQKESAEDVVKLMEALNLPASHIVGMSLGSIIALQMAISYPEKVASLFLVSPLGLEEPDDVTAARIEIYNYWTEGFLCQTGAHTDDNALHDSLYGALQFAFSNKQNSLTSAYANKFLPLAKRN
ncbi:alpha/beta-hydrolase, partial [Marasmius fiardii PR-910]